MDMHSDIANVFCVPFVDCVLGVCWVCRGLESYGSFSSGESSHEGDEHGDEDTYSGSGSVFGGGEEGADGAPAEDWQEGTTACLFCPARVIPWQLWCDIFCHGGSYVESAFACATSTRVSSLT